METKIKHGKDSRGTGQGRRLYMKEIKNILRGATMKVIVLKSNLLEGINTVQKAISYKATLPILEGLLLEAGEKLKLTGTDLEIGIESYVNADIQEKGSIVINSKMFGSIIRQLPDSEISIVTNINRQVIIECENSRFEIKGLSSEGYPALPGVNSENTFEIDQKTIKDMIRQTSFAVGTDENRPTLTGALVEYKNGELSIVTIDGFRMALRKNKVTGISNAFKALVPGRTLNEIGKILTTGKTSVCIDKNKILFGLNKCKIVSRLLDGEFINYNSLLPKDTKIQVKINTKSLLESIERAALLVDKAPITLDISKSRITITSMADAGQSREEVQADISGEDLKIGFNPKYFTDSLKVIDDEHIQINFTNNTGSCTITPTNGDGYTYMLLPVRLKS